MFNYFVYNLYIIIIMKVIVYVNTMRRIHSYACREVSNVTMLGN